MHSLQTRHASFVSPCSFNAEPSPSSHSARSPRLVRWGLPGSFVMIASICAIVGSCSMKSWPRRCARWLIRRSTRIRFTGVGGWWASDRGHEERTIALQMDVAKGTFSFSSIFRHS